MSVSSLRHDAFVYDSDEDFVARIAPFVEDGLEAGDAAVVVATRHNCRLLRDALDGGSSQVTFVDRDEFYLRPAAVIAGYDKTLRELLGGGAPAVRVIGEVQFGTTPREWDEWTAYESILNRAFAERRAWIVCPYDARVLPESVVHQAAHTHPEMLGATGEPSPHYHDPEELVRALTPAPAALPDLRPVAIDADGRGFRAQLRRELGEDGIPEAEAERMVLAAGEVLANAHRHGHGAATLRVGRVDDRFVCEISDHGPGLDDPLAGYLPPHHAHANGAGLWVARQLTWRLDLLPGVDGLTVRLWI
ncbi:MAG TPA: sensor histidine kinase [Solirubrobacteraceae bacterium]